MSDPVLRPVKCPLFGHTLFEVVAGYGTVIKIRCRSCKRWVLVLADNTTKLLEEESGGERATTALR